MIRLTLLGSPQSTQHCYKVACRPFASVYMTKEAKDLKLSYQWQTKSQYKGKILTNTLKLRLELFFGTKRRSDWDNFNKLVMDSLTGLIFADDSQIMEATVVKNYDKLNPRIELIIEEIN